MAFPHWLAIRPGAADDLVAISGIAVATRIELGRQRLDLLCLGRLCSGDPAGELPFLLHLAGTSEWQRLVVLGLGVGSMLASGALLFLCYRGLSPARVCLVAVNTAYLGNAALCLIVYSPGIGHLAANPGWPVTLAVLCFVVPEQLWIFVRSRVRLRGIDSESIA